MKKAHGIALGATIALTSAAGFASGQLIQAEAINRLTTDHASNTIVVHWGADANDTIRTAALTAVDGSVIGTDEDGSQIVSVGVGLTQARTVFNQFPSTIISSLESTTAFIGNQFGVDSHMLEVLAIPADASETVFVPVVLDGGIYTLELIPQTVRTDNFKVLIDNGDGELVEVEAPASATFRGRVVEMPGSAIAASIDEDGLTASIILHNDIDAGWFIQPLNEIVDGASSDLHVVYDSQAPVATDAVCGGALITDNPIVGVQPQEDVVAPRGGFIVAEIAYDADFQFYQKNGSNTTATINDIENVMNAVNVVYERDCGITFVITQTIVRSSSGSNPYTTNDAGTLLDQFRSHWQSNHGGVHRDIAHLMTGRNINGGTIGIAWLSAVCTSFGYGLSESRFTTNFAARTALTAHELGHNFSAGHCSGGSCRIMCAGLGGCGGLGLPNFSSGSANTITNYANGRGCLDSGPPPNTAPTIDIVLPFNNATSEQGDLVFFAATVDDAEEGDIGADTAWVSSLDGFFQTGNNFNYGGLSVGTHTVTATIFDSEGLFDTDTVTVIVEDGGAVTPPDRPARPTTQDLGSGVARVTWTDLPNEDEWDVERMEKIDGSYTNRTIVASALPANTTSYDDAAGFGTFRYRVRARNTAGTSQWSQWRVRVLKDTSVPTPPSDFSATDLGGGQAMLAWTDNSSNETKFEIQRRDHIGGSWVWVGIIASPAPNTESYIDSPGAGEYRYRVHARSAGGGSAWTPWGDGYVVITP